ncbi:MAG: fasciclin domain-containing protein [Cytophagales bacterium]|nr:fasciclin domain-containing protein [Cytophagales bacterium]
MKNFNTINRLLLVTAFTLTLGSCKDDFTSPVGLTGTPVGDTMAADPNFTIFTAIVKKTGQFAMINNINAGLVTVFSPSDPAFITDLSARYPAYFGPLAPVSEAHVLTFLGQLTATTTPTLAGFIATYVPIISYHLVSSKLTASLITGNQVFATLNGARLSISKTATATVLNANSSTNGATVTAFDVMAANGVTHTIDRVMAAVSSATVLTPMGVSISYNSNPPTVTGGTTSDTNDANFNLLAALIRVTGLTPTILPNSSPLPDFTVFQPTDGPMRAYLVAINGTLTTEALCYSYIASLISATPPPSPNPTLAQLTDLVKYHVVPGRFLTTDFTNGQVLTPLLTTPTLTMGISPIPPAAGPYTYTLADANTGVLDATITASNNILTNSGILHTVSGVLRPN